MTTILPTIPELVEAKLRGVPPEGWVDVGGYLQSGQFETEGDGYIEIDTIEGPTIRQGLFRATMFPNRNRSAFLFGHTADYARIRLVGTGMKIYWFVLYGKNERQCATFILPEASVFGGPLQVDVGPAIIAEQVPFLPVVNLR